MKVVVTKEQRQENRRIRSEQRKKQIAAFQEKVKKAAAPIKKKAVQFIKEKSKDPKVQEAVKGVLKQGVEKALGHPQLNEYLYGVPKRLIGAAKGVVDVSDINMVPRFVFGE